VLTLIASTPNICKSIHMPAQSGNSRVLDIMRRGYTREAYLELIKRAREIIPSASGFHHTLILSLTILLSSLTITTMKTYTITSFTIISYFITSCFHSLLLHLRTLVPSFDLCCCVCHFFFCFFRSSRCDDLVGLYFWLLL
jgi:hypothetical protein